MPLGQSVPIWNYGNPPTSYYTPNGNASITSTAPIPQGTVSYGQLTGAVPSSSISLSPGTYGGVDSTGVSAYNGSKVPLNAMFNKWQNRMAIEGRMSDGTVADLRNNNMNALAPLPSNFNPTGVNNGVVDSNSGAQNIADLMRLNPAVPSVGSVPVLGSPNGSPFKYSSLPSSIGTGLVPNNAASRTPEAAPNTFGYPTVQPPTNVGALVPGAGTLDPSLVKALDKTYGKGFGQTVYNVLKSGAGFNPQVANAFVNSIQPYFESHMNDILEAFGASGQRFASTAALAVGKFSADFTAQEQSLFAQMYQWAYQNFLQTLSYGKVNTSSNIFGNLNNILGLAGKVGGALSDAGIGGTATQVIGAL